MVKIHRQLSLLLATLLTLLVITESTNLASAEEPILVKVLYTKIDKPMVDTTNEPQLVKYSVIVISESRPIVPSDFYCLSPVTPIEPEITALSNQEYEITCQILFDSTVKTGIARILLRQRNNINLFPSNLKNTSPTVYQNDFGKEVITNRYDFETILQRGADPTFALVAVNAPKDFEFPSLPKLGADTIVFDSRNITTKEMKVLLEKSKRKFSIDCPLVAPKSIRITRKLYAVSFGSFVGSFVNKLPTFSYTDKKFKGRTLNIQCSVLAFTSVGAKEMILPVSYTESRAVKFKFPNN